MHDLESFGDVDPNVIFHCFYVKTTDFMVLKVSVVFHKLARIGSLASCWRYSNVIPLSKSGSSSSIPSEHRLISIIPVLSEVFQPILAQHLNAYAETNDLFPSLQFGFPEGLGT